jgi:pimeloyl-ACP methyl ester carboxylesterase/DNA-binding CsgD family transcriptional regulator
MIRIAGAYAARPSGRTGSVYRQRMEQEIRFVATEHGRLAFATVGSGPPLVLGCWWLGHLELQWESALFRSWIERLAETHTVVRFDRPGIGLSEPATRELDAEDEAALAATVLDDLALGPAVAFGASCGGCGSIALSVVRGDLVSHLVLYGAYADGSAITTPEVRESLTRLFEAHWGIGSQVLADIFMPDATAEAREDFARYQRRAVTPDVAARNFQIVHRLEAGPWIGDVAVPTLVIHRRGDRAIPVELGRDLAARIRGARFVPLAGRDHFPWIGDLDSVMRPLHAFVGSPMSAPTAADDGNPLSEREREVLHLVALGLSDGEISEQLVVSPHTAHRHVANIRRKLRQPSRAAAVAEATRRGWL